LKRRKLINLAKDYGVGHAAIYDIEKIERRLSVL
jgi:hypothetical protein